MAKETFNGRRKYTQRREIITGFISDKVLITKFIKNSKYRIQKKNDPFRKCPIGWNKEFPKEEFKLDKNMSKYISFL